MFTSIIAGAAIALSALVPVNPHAHPNGLRECTSAVRVSCVALTDEPTGRFIVRDSHGKAHHKRNGAAVLHYAQRTSVPCPQEDSAGCYWDSRQMGNGFGDSFVVVGVDTVWYLDNQE